MLIETLITRAPWSTPQWMPCAIRAAVGPNPFLASSSVSLRKTRTDSSAASGASPTTPDPATGRAAISPAITVP
jgi:hypothetical protein